jgi:hypothetical protein
MNGISFHLMAAGLLVLVVGAAWAVPAAPPALPQAQAPTIQSTSGPFTYGNLTIYLLHGPDVLSGKKIITLQEALAQDKAVVHETSSVNELSVENLSDDCLVFIQSGDIVKGGKQDRAIAFDMLLPPKSGTVWLGAFCVESGRWRQRGTESAYMFGASTDQIAGRDLKRSVVGATAGMQSEVWRQVGTTQAKLANVVGGSVAAPASPSSLQLSLENKEVAEKLAGYEKALAHVVDGKSDVIGMVVCINGKIEGADIYGSAALFQKLWAKLLKSAATEALSELDPKAKFEPATAKEVATFLTEAAAAPATQVQVSSSGPLLEAIDRKGIRLPPATPSRVRIVRYETGKAVLVESQDQENPTPAVMHRCYIAT